jgi:23S rRNA-intervening sequence protein
MSFHHEKLTVYQRALDFAGWSQTLIESVTEKTSTRDHVERAGGSIALNIAEGNGKFLAPRSRSFFADCSWLRVGVGRLFGSFLSRGAAANHLLSLRERRC